MKIPDILALLTLIAVIGIGLGLLALSVPASRRWAVRLLKAHGLQLAFLTAIIATAGSLALSEISHFTPCVLCWYQRIAMYPLVVLLAYAVLSRRPGLRAPVLTLAAIGAVIAVDHILIQLGGPSLQPCSGTPFAVPCGVVVTRHFGFITIPVMALVAFVLVGLGTAFARPRRQEI